jgi:hypothetical protein
LRFVDLTRRFPSLLTELRRSSRTQRTGDPLMTRRQFVEFVQRQTGIPLTYSRLMKDGAIGRAPRPTAIFGKRYLYSEADALSYAKALVRSTEAGEAAR